MFACVSQDDDDSVTGFSRRGGKKQVEQEDDLINKVLEEGLRLKKRCKVLTAALSDAEARAAAQREVDQKSYKECMYNVQAQIDQEVSRVSSMHAIEQAHLYDIKNREIDDLQNQVRKLLLDHEQREPIIQELELANSSLIDQLGSLQEKHEKELQRFLVEHEGEKKALIMRREDVADEQRSSLLRRALLAENEAQRLAADLDLKSKADQDGLISITDNSPQSMNFTHEMNCLRELIEKTKAEFFVEQKAKTQLAAECQSLQSQLIERTNERDKYSAAFLSQGTREREESIQLASEMDKVRKNLQDRCRELEDLLAESQDDVRELEGSVNELLMGKAAVTDAVAAVQLENRKLKGELALLGRSKEKMEKEFRESGPRKETEGRLAEVIKEHRSARKKDTEKEQGKESDFDGKNKRKLDEKANNFQSDKLFISPPTSPVSFVSRAICQIEGKSPIDIRARSTSISPMTRASSTSVSSTVSLTPTAVHGVANATEMTVRTSRRGIESGDSTDNTDDASLTSVNSSNEGGQTAPLRFNAHSDKVMDAKEVTKLTSNTQDSREAPHLVPETATFTNRDRDRDRDRNATNSITNNYASTFLFPLLPVPRSASKSAHTKSKSIENYNYSARSGTPPQQPTSLATTSPKLTLDTSCESQSTRAPQLTPKRKLAGNAPQ